MPTEIVPRLWLGDHRDAEDVPAGATLVVNCTRDVPFSHDSPAARIRVPVDDLGDPAEQATLVEHWVRTGVVAAISTHLEQGHAVLVHCKMGRQRSAATVAAFLMATQGMSKDGAIAYIKSKKRDAFFPNVNFDGALARHSDALRMHTTSVGGSWP